LADVSPRPRWVERLDELPGDAPILLIANELFDCLPVRQFVRTETGMAERRVGLAENGALVFGLAPLLESPSPPGVSAGAVLEIAETQRALADEIVGRISEQSGAALVIDYGRIVSGFGDTLQALRHHEKVDPLAAPGEADLTVHVDFAAILGACFDSGAACAILTQGEFLRRLGIEERARALAAARPERAARIGRQLERLIGDDAMGVLFKAACIHDPAFVPPAFEGR